MLWAICKVSVTDFLLIFFIVEMTTRFDIYIVCIKKKIIILLQTAMYAQEIFSQNIAFDDTGDKRWRSAIKPPNQQNKRVVMALYRSPEHHWSITVGKDHRLIWTIPVLTSALMPFCFSSFPGSAVKFMGLSQTFTKLLLNFMILNIPSFFGGKIQNRSFSVPPVQTEFNLHDFSPTNWKSTMTDCLKRHHENQWHFISVHLFRSTEYWS